MHGITNIFTKDENAIHNTEMRILENDLIPVYETNSGEKVVYGTELHAGLGSPSVYREWAKRRLSDVDAVENEDYTTAEIPTVSGGLPRKDHIIKLDTAKEMAMLERNEKGKQVRRYFIRVEKKYKELIDRYFKTEYGKYQMSGVVPDYSISHFMSEEILTNLCKNAFGVPHV